ncbi:MAG: cyclic nucleotide-binding domain-containing protein [Nitrospina sp.]|jgi:CRP/FNR family transcriptional regulator, cyclic AMP receptor protein|nr:cyclic nucleotide-binding domain-containing protein [Nitrospina sp.]MBT3416405.1 cyclic nucleotide-binding domain-containing protein [Nitrospina sp.]MBT3855426.1 cyclic nucleotide-binding domain-containing protein [Nitrospina sp.]MBT4103941.1 cyclic nucleotide-binding domain-containing protein [Nitrospina sp.]MBT4388502.1 cyclic nucleotide-binding domain-containing protein [Nitrospina sp.]
MPNQAEILKFKRGETIIHEGEQSGCAYILESGMAEVCKSLPNGDQQFVGTLVQNDIFGELGLIDGLPRSATVKATDSCKIRKLLSQETFGSVVRNNPQALMPILKVLVNRLRHTLRLLDKLEKKQLTSKTVPAGSL